MCLKTLSHERVVVVVAVAETDCMTEREKLRAEFHRRTSAARRSTEDGEKNHQTIVRKEILLNTRLTPHLRDEVKYIRRFYPHESTSAVASLAIPRITSQLHQL